MVAEFGVRDLFLGNFAVANLDCLTRASAKRVGMRSYRIAAYRNAVKRSICRGLVAIFVGVRNTVNRDRLAIKCVILCIVSKGLGVIGRGDSLYITFGIIGKGSFTADAVNGFGKLLIGIVGIVDGTISTGNGSYVPVHVFSACSFNAGCHCCFYRFSIGMLTAVSICHIVIYAVERHGLDSLLAVIFVSYRVVSTFHLGYNAKRACLCGAVFLAVFGAVGDGGYRTVLCCAVGEFAAVRETLGFNGYAVGLVIKVGFMLTAFVPSTKHLSVFIHLIFGVEFGRGVKGIVGEGLRFKALVIEYVLFNMDTGFQFLALNIGLLAYEVARVVVVVFFYRNRDTVSLTAIAVRMSGLLFDQLTVIVVKILHRGLLNGATTVGTRNGIFRANCQNRVSEAVVGYILYGFDLHVCREIFIGVAVEAGFVCILRFGNEIVVVSIPLGVANQVMIEHIMCCDVPGALINCVNFLLTRVVSKPCISRAVRHSYR